MLHTMIRHLFVAVLFCCSALFAFEPPAPLKVNLELGKCSGVSQPFTVNVVITAIDVLPAESQNADAEIKLFLPPALHLLQGELKWKGIIPAGGQVIRSIIVQADGEQLLVYDVGVVLKSNYLRKTITSRISVLLGKNAGLDLSVASIDQTLEKHSWAKEALGLEATETFDKTGKTIITYSAVIDRIQPQSDLDGKSLQEARPNKLYQKEWLDYIAPPEHKIKADNIDTTPRKRKANTDTRLQTDYYHHYGIVRNSTGYLRGVKVGYSNRNTMQRLGDVYTDTNGRFEITQPSDVTLTLLISTVTASEDEVNWYSLRYEDERVYSITDYSYQITGDSVYWGTINFNDVSSMYDEGADAFFELELISRRTRDDNGYNVPACLCIYPGNPDVLGDALGIYLSGDNKMHIATGYQESISHEFGHHIHYSKGVRFTNYDPYYSWECDYLTTRETAYYEGWAESYLNWRFNDSSVESYSCSPTTIRFVKTAQAGFWDLHDTGNDGEQCSLSMSNMLAAFRYNDNTILSYLSYLTSLNPSYATQIANVQSVNKLYDQTLLAVAQESPALPAAAVKTELLQNQPNPFNPSTTINYSIGGSEAIEVSLNIYDTRGRMIKSLISGSREPGFHSVFWDGTDRNGRSVASGVYFYRLNIGDYSKTRKMVILK